MSESPIIQSVPVDQLSVHEENPREITAAAFEKLKTSLKDFPEMLQIRPVVYVTDEAGGCTVIGGNMRLRAARALNWETVPAIDATHLTPAQRREFLIKDNVQAGEWDYDALANGWGEEAQEWGVVTIEPVEEVKNPYTRRVQSPIYVTTGEQPAAHELYDTTRLKSLLEKIESEKGIDDQTREFLRHAAYRHVRFDFGSIAEFYAHVEAPIQRLMEDSALVVVDFERAIEQGFVRLSEEVQQQYMKDYAEHEENKKMSE